jgi:hypothetical protein
MKNEMNTAHMYNQQDEFKISAAVNEKQKNMMIDINFWLITNCPLIYKKIRDNF